MGRRFRCRNKIFGPLRANPRVIVLIEEGQYSYIYVNPIISFFSNRLFFTVCNSEMNITGTLPPLLLMAKSGCQILRDTSPRHACLGEVSRESASRQSRELIMRSKRTTNVQRGGRRESQGRVNVPFV